MKILKVSSKESTPREVARKRSEVWRGCICHVLVLSQAGHYFMPLLPSAAGHCSFSTRMQQDHDRAPSSWLCRQMVGLPSQHNDSGAKLSLAFSHHSPPPRLVPRPALSAGAPRRPARMASPWSRDLEANSQKPLGFLTREGAVRSIRLQGAGSRRLALDADSACSRRPGHTLQ